MEWKTNFQCQNIESSALYPHVQHSLFFTDTTNVPISWPFQHVIAKATLHDNSLCSFISPSWLLIPPGPQASFTPSWQSLLWWPMLHPASFSSLFPISPAHVPIHGAALTASMLYFWPCQKQAKGLWDPVFIKSAVVYSDVLGLHIHSPPTQQLTHTTSSPTGSIHGKCPIRVCRFLYFMLCFTAPFLCLHMFRHTNPVVLKLHTVVRAVVACCKGV